MAKILDNPDIFKRNFQGELVLTGIAEPHTNFNSLFTSMVGRVHDLDQHGIDKFLGALNQIGMKTTIWVGKHYNDCTHKSRLWFGHLHECPVKTLINQILFTVETKKIKSSQRLSSQAKDISARLFNHQAKDFEFYTFINLI